MIEFVLRAGTRNAFENMMKSHGLMKGNGELHDDVVTDPYPGSLEYPTGIPIPDSASPAPYFVNVRVSGAEEQNQIAGFPQYDEQGNLLPQYLRTKLGNLVYKTGKPWTADNGTTTGATLNNVTFIYRGTIKTRRRVWQ